MFFTEFLRSSRGGHCLAASRHEAPQSPRASELVTALALPLVCINTLLTRPALTFGRGYFCDDVLQQFSDVNNIARELIERRLGGHK